MTMPGLSRRHLLAAAGAVLLTGCASLTPPVETIEPLPPDAQRLSGRLAVRVEGDADRSFSAVFDLLGDARHGQLQLSSTLGTSLAQARWQRDHILLQTSDSRYEFDSLDTLAERALGEPVPLEALIDWLQARPWPAAASTPLDPQQPARGFTQLGWEVDLSRYAEAALLVATRRQPAPTVTVRARLDRS